MSHQYPKTVLCVGKDTVNAVLEEIEKINRFAYADIIELRADYIKEEELTEENLAKKMLFPKDMPADYYKGGVVWIK